MKLKKIIATILIVSIAAGFCSCGITADFPPSKKIENLAYGNDGGETFESAVKKFSLNSAANIFLDVSNKNKNLCYSPVSLYIALALTATGAENQTQSEMFEVLGLNGKDKDYISSQAKILLTKMQSNNLKIADSIWLKKDAELKKDFEKNAKDNFYSPVFNVDFKDVPATPELMKKWVEDNTNQLISPEFAYADPDIFMYIINTLYYKSSWEDGFYKQANTRELFHGINGQDAECDFMNKIIWAHSYFKGHGFIASYINFNDGAKMTFILPDEDTDIYDLLKSPKKLEYIFDENNVKTGDVTFKVPKFESKSSFDLNGALKKMGMTQAFLPNGADFSGITNEPVYIDQVSQDTYIKVDENGVEAAAMTKIAAKASGIVEREPNDKINLFLDRPFIYFITDKNGIILFEGVIFNLNQ